MKKLLTVLWLLILSTAYAENIKGINFNPEDSAIFALLKNTKHPDINRLQALIGEEIDFLKTKGFTYFKTNYASYPSPQFPLAKFLCAKEVKVLITIHQFDVKSKDDPCDDERACRLLTEEQIQAAIETAAEYPDCVKGIVFSNEDVFSWNDEGPAMLSEENKNIQENLAKDLQNTKEKLRLRNLTVKVGLALDFRSLLKFAGKKIDETGKLTRDDKIYPDSYQLIEKADFLGANLMLYKYGQPFKDTIPLFDTSMKALKTTFPEKTIIVSGEGWPTEGLKTASKLESDNYFAWWKNREDGFASYYYQAYNHFDIQDDGLGSASRYLGILKDLGYR